MKHLSISIQIDKHLNFTPFLNKQQQTEKICTCMYVCGLCQEVSDICRFCAHSRREGQHDDMRHTAYSLLADGGHLEGGHGRLEGRDSVSSLRRTCCPFNTGSKLVSAAPATLVVVPRGIIFLLVLSRAVRSRVRHLPRIRLGLGAHSGLGPPLGTGPSGNQYPPRGSRRILEKVSKPNELN